MSDSRPNILLIMTDQHRGDCLSIDGHPVLTTPNLDAIGGQGVRFSRGYTTCPSCTPARRSLMSGQWPVNHGMVGYTDGQEWHPPATLPDELRKAGYQTGLVGRTMHQWPRRKRFGFETQELVTGNDDKSRPVDWEIEMARYPEGPYSFHGHGINGNGWVARPWHLDEHMHPVNYITTRSIQWLQQRDPTCPFFLVVSYNPPHPPSTPVQTYYDRYINMDLPKPHIGEWADRPENDGLGLPAASDRCVLEGHKAQQAQAGYYGAINHVDDQIARILECRGLDLSNTIVIFTADHGEMMGDHYLFRKTYPYEGSARVPFMAKGPGLARGVVHDHPVCLEDIMPTCLDLAGVDIPDSVDGASLAPILRGQTTDPVRDVLHGEHAQCYRYEQANHYLTDHQWKYIWWPHDNSEQLFDLHADPNELVDLSSDKQHKDTAEGFRQQLIDRLRNRPEGFVEGDQLVAGKAYPAALPWISAQPDDAPRLA